MTILRKGSGLNDLPCIVCSCRKGRFAYGRRFYSRNSGILSGLVLRTKDVFTKLPRDVFWGSDGWGPVGWSRCGK